MSHFRGTEAEQRDAPFCSRVVPRSMKGEPKKRGRSLIETLRPNREEEPKKSTRIKKRFRNVTPPNNKKGKASANAFPVIPE